MERTGTEEQRKIWQRVTPTLDPWPGADAVGRALKEGADVEGVILSSGTPEVQRDAADLPGAEPDPCCMGTEALTDLAVIAGFAEDEQMERRQMQALARQAPVWARQTLLTLAGYAAARLRRLIAAYYLITGEVYIPTAATEKIYAGRWLPALRERYHSVACTAMNYQRAADGTPDPCLNDLFRELSADAFQSANTVSHVLERALSA